MDHNVRVPATTVATGRDPAIDMAKGVAILWVLLIHSDALHQNLLFRHVVNHAVPVFVVFFGLNSTLWWRRRNPRTDALAWYRRGVRRILVPVWGALVLWWAMALWFRPFGVPLTWWLPFAHAAGFLLHVGTGWFVTMILQLFALQPFAEAAARRVGRPALLVVGLATSAAMAWLGFWIVGWSGLFGYWVMSPRFFAHVAFGMVLADRRDRLGLGTAVLAGLVVVGGVVAEQALHHGVVAFDPRWLQEVGWIESLALAVGLLVALRPLARVPALGAALAWFGQSSYGVYIGQLITHNFFVYWYGLDALYQALNLWLYTVILLAGGVGFVWLGEVLLRLGGHVAERAGIAQNPRIGARSA
jgi:peptidoglycan/LPS O-acetylase OafA/YrhL